MSELKEIGIRWEENGELHFSHVYLKSEADKVIAGKDTEIQRLRRALWLARAEKGKHIATFCYYALHYGRVPVREIYQCQDKWDEVERKCRAKAEEYK